MSYWKKVVFGEKGNQNDEAKKPLVLLTMFYSKGISSSAINTYENVMFPKA